MASLVVNGVIGYAERVVLPESVPELVARALTKLTGALEPLDDVRGLVLYGSLARGEYRAAESDVNLVVSLERGSAEALSALREPLRAAWRAVRVEPFLVRATEVVRLADVFPLKILDIHQHHVVLTGEDPFAEVRVMPADVRTRTEQQLRNHLLRLRRHYVFSGNNPVALAPAVYRSTKTLRHELGGLLQLRGEAVGWRVASVLPAAARVLGLDGGTLTRLERFHAGNDEPELVELFLALLNVVEQAVSIADEMVRSP